MSRRQLDEHRASESFERKLEQLRFELRIGAPRRVLDYLLDHLGDLLPRLGPTLLRASLGEQLERAKVLVASRHNLRLVHDGERPRTLMRAVAFTPSPITLSPKGPPQ